MNPSATLFAALVLLVSFENGLCTKCYQCTSTNNANCKDAFNNPKAVATVDCTSNEIVNFYNTYLSGIIPSMHTINAPKYCLKMSLGGTLGDTIIRTCVEGASDNMNKTCSELERNSLGQFVSTVSKQTLKHCSVCDGDLCNGAASTAASVGLATVVAGLVAYLAY